MPSTVREHAVVDDQVMLHAEAHERICFPTSRALATCTQNARATIGIAPVCKPDLVLSVNTNHDCGHMCPSL
eukprot:8115423-Pyramimonas_sp.AAC.1